MNTEIELKNQGEHHQSCARDFHFQGKRRCMSDGVLSTGRGATPIGAQPTTKKPFCCRMV